jgi:hypothetical protein
MLKPIPGFKGYFAGDNGSIYCNLPMGKQIGIGNTRELSPAIQSSGKYFYVSIKSDSGKRTTKRVHRLVCLAFWGIPNNEKDTVSHLDGNWRNNKPHNLRWESLSDNHNRKKEHGTDDIGINNSRAHIDIKTLKEIRRLLKLGTLTQKAIGEKFGLNRLFITKIANGYRYKNQGLL